MSTDVSTWPPDVGIEPYYLDDRVVIFNADCRDVLPNVSTVDIVLSDPPFGVRSEQWDDMDEQEFCRFSMEWLALARRVTPNLAAFFASGMPFMKLCELIYPRTRQLIWHKPLGSQYAGSSDCRMWYAYEPIAQCWEPRSWEVVEPKNMEVASLIRAAREGKGLSRGGVDMVVRGKKTGLCFRWEEAACLPTPEQAEQLCSLLGLNGEFNTALERAYANRNEVMEKAAEKAAELADVLTHRTVTNGQHPCEKPVGLLQDLIVALTERGQSILDPFAGSCTTAVAAKQLGRRCICIELEERYCEIGAQRCRQGVLW